LGVLGERLRVSGGLLLRHAAVRQAAKERPGVAILFAIAPKNGNSLLLFTEKTAPGTGKIRDYKF